MKNKILSVLGIVALMAGVFGAAVPAHAGPPGPEPRPMPVDPDFHDMQLPASSLPGKEEISAAEKAAEEIAASTASTCIDGTNIFFNYDFKYGSLDVEPYILMAQGDTAQVWVQVDLSWPSGDSRATPVITCDQAKYMLGEFETNIYPTEIDFFGSPDFHDGSSPGFDLPALWSDPEGRQLILVQNIKDDNYYDPNFPLYIAGFYWTFLDQIYDRNTMTIDAFDWENRTGLNSDNTLYEGVFAHEYQHLLHSDYDSDESTWVNEGLSDLAEYLVGYGHPESHVSDTAEFPENSLTVWEDQGGLEILSDYGHAYMFMLYLMDQYGEGVIQDLFLDQGNSIDGVNSALTGDTKDDFTEVYHNYSTALLIDNKKAGGQWEFDSIDFNLNLGTPASPNPEAYDTPGAPPWGTDYLWLDSQLDGHSWKDFLGFEFNGVPYTVNDSAWSSDGDVLFSGAGNLLDNWAIFETTGGGTLTFDTAYHIEESWDFGFVQVSTDGGETWTSLENNYTTDVTADGAHPKVVANVPGLTGVNPDYPDMTTMSFDLSAYEGQDILVGFRYVTDWAFIDEGWYVDNVYVDDTLISDGSDLTPFKDLTYYQPIENDFHITLVGIRQVGRGNPYKVMELPLDDLTEDGLTNIRKLLKDHTDVVLMVTYEADAGVTDYADYDFELIFQDDWPDK